MRSRDLIREEPLRHFKTVWRILAVPPPPPEVHPTGVSAFWRILAHFGGTLKPHENLQKHGVSEWRILAGGFRGSVGGVEGTLRYATHRMSGKKGIERETKGQ